MTVVRTVLTIVHAVLTTVHAVMTTVRMTTKNHEINVLVHLFRLKIKQLKN